MFVLIVIALILMYLIGLVLVYGHTSDKMNTRNIVPNGEEAGMLLRLIILYPIFYPEIEVFLNTCDKR
jgi:hypothetical protein